MKCQCKDSDGNRCQNEATIESDGFMDAETHGYGTAFDNHQPFPNPPVKRTKKQRKD